MNVGKALTASGLWQRIYFKNLENNHFVDRECRELIIRMDMATTASMGPKGWISIRRFSKPVNFVYHVLIGAFGTLFADTEECIYPLIGEDRVYSSIEFKQVNLIGYKGYNVYHKHAALVSYLTYFLRLADCICSNDSWVRSFRRQFRFKQKDLERAIAEKDTGWIKENVIPILKTKFTGWHVNWCNMDSDLRFWMIFDALVYFFEHGKFAGSRPSHFSQYDGALSWWLNMGCARAGVFDWYGYRDQSCMDLQQVQDIHSYYTRHSDLTGPLFDYTYSGYLDRYVEIVDYDDEELDEY